MPLFPKDFFWGTASAAYQIEGGAYEDQRGVSIWDTFSHTPGRVKNGDTGDVTSDHYHRWREDVALMKQMHLNAYRLSTAWTRVLPVGRGVVNEKGLDFYDRLIDELLKSGITPFITLYHWDLPQALQDEGNGWERRGIVDDFAAYTDVLTRALGDRVKHWITLNEPFVFVFLGYLFGSHAPGQSNPMAAMFAAHHALLAHGRAVPVIRANVPGAQVGIALNMTPMYPASDSPADVAAARRHDGFVNRLFLDPLFKGEYPQDIMQQFGFLMPTFPAEDLAEIAAPLDFLGINNYFRDIIREGDEFPLLNTAHVRSDLPRTAMDWEIYPPGIYDLLRRVHADYAPAAIYITENGAAFDDVVSEDGAVHDPQRVAYLRDYIAACARAHAEGVPLKGYFAWSLLDNFEWAEGLAKRFGVVYVDYPTGTRILKDSGRYLGELARETFAAP